MQPFSFQLNHEEVFVKDMELACFIRKFPKLSALAKRLRSELPDGYKNYLVDFIVHEQKPGMNTCRDVRWHIDGDFDKNNKYVLWVKGPNRTMFPEQVPDLKDLPQDRNEQNVFLENLMENLPSYEVPEETIISYDSKVPHKGVVCKSQGKRYFIRMMATNYIKPKFLVKEKIHAQL